MGFFKKRDGIGEGGDPPPKPAKRDLGRGGQLNHDAPWHLGDVDLSKLEGHPDLQRIREEDPERAERIKGYLEKGEQGFQEIRRRQGYRSLEEQRKFWDQQELEDKLREDKPPVPLPHNHTEFSQLDGLGSEREKVLQSQLDDAIGQLSRVRDQRSRALSTAIQAIHDIEEDDSFSTNDLNVAVAYLAALTDPQD